MMNILVTGGAGFIGSHVLEKLHAMADMHAVVFDNLTSGSAENVPQGMELVTGDVRDMSARERLFARHSFESA